MRLKSPFSIKVKSRDLMGSIKNERREASLGFLLIEMEKK